MKDLTPSQKAELHEVADGMLKVYQTLVRMRYLDASLIQEGPHNVDHLLPLYRSLGLDPSIIYLYSILPYVKPGDDGGGGDFFQGGEFADFRDGPVLQRCGGGCDAAVDDASVYCWEPPHGADLRCSKALYWHIRSVEQRER